MKIFFDLGLFLILPICLAISVIHLWENYSSLYRTVEHDPTKSYISELGGYLPNQWQDHINTARTHSDVSFIEEYWGLWGAVVKTPMRTPTDSVIHALGRTRKLFSDAIQSLPDFIITTTFTSSFVWQPWSVSANYWFYKPTFENYQVIQYSPTTVLWEKRNSDNSDSELLHWPPETCEINSSLKPSFRLPEAKPGFYEITLDYDFKTNSHRSIVMVQNNINYAVDAPGYLSLNPRGHKEQFPVAVPIGNDGTFDFRIFTPQTSQAGITIKSCSARSIPIQDEEVLPQMFTLGSSTAANVTNKNWLKGFSRKDPSFVVPRTMANKHLFQPGKIIKFGNQKREIYQVEEVRIRPGPYLRVHVSGSYLDGNVFGNPYPLEFIN